MIAGEPGAGAIAGRRPAPTATFTIEIAGAIVGRMWMPTAKAAKPFTYRITAEIRRASAGASFAEILERALAAEDGDFSTAGRLTADTNIEFRRAWSTSRRVSGDGRDMLADGWSISRHSRSRIYSAAELARRSPAIAELVSAEDFSFDYLGEDF